MLKVQNISKVLPDGTPILSNISFSVKKGEFLGILGPSGAGKSLTMRCILGLTRPTSGKVLLEDGQATVNINECKGKALRMTRQKIGAVFQGFHLIKGLTAIENVMVGRLGSINTFRSILYGFTDQEAQTALQALENVNIGHLAHRKVGSLSGGEMQRVAIARALFQKPLLLLADEPIANLDPSNAHKIMKILRPLSKEMPVAGIFHQPHIIANYCSRVIAIQKGQVVYDGDPHLSYAHLKEIYGEELASITEPSLQDKMAG